MFVADTHAWVYYLLNKLPHKSNKVFTSIENGDDIILVPTISLSECVHLIERKRIVLTYNELFSRLEESNNFVVVPLTFEIVKLIPEIRLKELHDKIIVATAKFLKSALITKDKEIIKSGIVNTIWN